MKEIIFTSSDLEKEMTPEYQEMLDELVSNFDKEEYYRKEASYFAPTDEDTVNYSKEGN